MARHLQRLHPKSYMEWRRKRSTKQSVHSSFDFKNRSKKKSCIWSFFDYIDNKAICNLCGLNMKRNMSRHLYNKHPAAHKCWQNMKKKCNTSTWPSKENASNLVNTRAGWVKQYIKRTGTNKYRCQLCHKVLKMRTGCYSNMKRHIRLKHPHVYDREIRKYRDTNTKEISESEENIEDHQEYVVEYIDSNDPLLDNDTIKSQDNELKNSDLNSLNCQINTEVEKNEESSYTDNSDDAEYLETDEMIHDYDSENEDEISTNDVGEKSSEDGKIYRLWEKQYLKKLCTNKYLCKLCLNTMKMSEWDNKKIKKHFSINHPYIYDEKIGECKNIDKDNSIKCEKSTTDVVEYVVEYIDNDPLTDDGDVICSISKSNNESEYNDMNPNGGQRSSGRRKANKNERPTLNDDSDHTDDDYLKLSEILRDNDPLLEVKIQKLCNKYLGKIRKRNKTCLWNFFDVLFENHLYRCLFCGKQVAVYQKNIRNLKLHLENKHTWQYNLILKYAPERDTCKTNRFKQTKRLESALANASNEDIDFLDRGSLKCKICEEMVICGDNKKVLIDHFVEKHPEYLIECQSQDFLNDENEYKVIIDADDDSYVIQI